jgi:hypothetical protein
MKKIYYTLILFFIIDVSKTKAQYFTQYFDGADTSLTNSVFIELDTNSSNIWQIGRPQKIIFDHASTIPNVIVTDTISNYPVNNTSSFSFKVIPTWISWGLLAVQWNQKLDMLPHHDGGIIEYSVDTGQTWHNIMNNPYIYNFYGYDYPNLDTLQNGQFCFSGTDTSWRNIWMCMDISWVNLNGIIYFRYTFKSDSVSSNKEGWMIDNFFVSQSLMHPVREANSKDYLHVYPNPAKDILNIEIQKAQEFHMMESMKLVTSSGAIVKEWKNVPTKFWIDTSKIADGLYFLKVKTNLKSETVPVFIKKN